jgi:hypothetical protein
MMTFKLCNTAAPWSTLRAQATQSYYSAARDRAASQGLRLRKREGDGLFFLKVGWVRPKRGCLPLC